MVYFSIKKGIAQLPTDLSVPMILIGPGTGIAPVRSFFQARQKQLHLRRHQRQSETTASKCIGSMSIYFGCRKKAKDFLFEEEWITLSSSSSSNSRSCAPSADSAPASSASSAMSVFSDSADQWMLTVAFSREQLKKFYVTDAMRLQAQHLWALLQQGAVVYVSGSSKRLPKGVKSAIVDVVMREGGLSDYDANAYVSGLQRSKRLLFDVW